MTFFRLNVRLSRVTASNIARRWCGRAHQSRQDARARSDRRGAFVAQNGLRRAFESIRMPRRELRELCEFALPDNDRIADIAGCPLRAMKRHARRFAPKFCTGVQKGGFHVAILSESRRGRHAPNVRSTALAGK